MATELEMQDLRFTSRFEALSKGEQDPVEAWSKRKAQRRLFLTDDIPPVGARDESDGAPIIYTYRGTPFEVTENWIRRVGEELRPWLGRMVVYAYWRRLTRR